MNKKLLVVALGVAVLAGCGGGGGSSSSAQQDTPVNQTTTAESVTVASQATVASAGLTKIATASSNEIAYDVAADPGDTWRIILNTATNTFSVKVISTQYGLKDRTGSFTVTTAGNVTTYTGTDFKLAVDNRTLLVTGNVKVGTKTATVSGSGYSAGDLSKLAGIYLYVGAVRNLSNGLDRGILAGGFKLKADSTIDVCDGGVFNAAGNCTQISGFATPVPVTLTMAKDSNTGVIKILLNNRDWGIAHVHAGDHGPALIIDRFGLNDAGTAMRVGSVYAATPAKLTSQLDGSYACSDQGSTSGTITVAGTKAKVTNLSTNSTHDEDIGLNKASNGSAIGVVDGVATFSVPGEGIDGTVNILPLSSSIFVGVQQDSSFVTVCARQ